MFTDSTEYLAYCTNLQSKHDGLERLIEKVTKAWLLGSKRFDRGLAHQLESLRDALKQHFHEETEEGCLDEAVARRPSLSKELTRLESEHVDMLRDIDELISKVEQSPRIVGVWEDNSDLFFQLIRRLRSHESAETQMLEKGFGNYP